MIFDSAVCQINGVQVLTAPCLMKYYSPYFPIVNTFQVLDDKIKSFKYAQDGDNELDDLESTWASRDGTLKFIQEVYDGKV